MVDAPGPRRPAGLGDEQVGHQGLEHVAAPARHDVHATVGVGALEDVDAVVGVVSAHRLLLEPVPVTAGREHPLGGEVVSRWDLAVSDTDVARDPWLGDMDVVVAGRVEDIRAVAEVVARDRCLRRRDIVETVAQQSGSARFAEYVRVNNFANVKKKAFEAGRLSESPT